MGLKKREKSQHLPLSQGFTLIEFLVVVAVISVLAAIVAPNIQQARVRSKVVRVQQDMAQVGASLELYYSDSSAYPPYYVTPSVIYPRIQRLVPLTTPIAYLSKVPIDIFNRLDMGGNEVFLYAEHTSYFLARLDLPLSANVYDDVLNSRTIRAKWIIHSRGPTGRWLLPPFGATKVYDPTNGIVSNGDITRWGP